VEFIAQMRAFEKLSAGNLTPNAIAIYWKLFMIDNATGWKEWFTESDYWLGYAVGIKRHETIVAALNLLKQKGFIDFERGIKRNQPTKYKIIVLNNSIEDSTKDRTITSTKDSTITSTKDSTKHSDIPRHNTKTKDKDIYAGAFATFWAAYPKKVKKAVALKSFEKLKPSDDLLKTMLDSLEKFKQTDQWQKNNGQFIPDPSSWLNQRRWEDEFTVNLNTTPVTLSAEEQAKRKAENERRSKAAMDVYRAKVAARFGGAMNGDESSERSAS